MDLTPLLPNPWMLAAAVLADAAIGDPEYPAHPVRLIGKMLAWFEGGLRRIGADGYGGGIGLLLMLTLVWVVGTGAAVVALARWDARAAWVVHFFLLYSFLAMHDLLRHAWAVERAASKKDVKGARIAIAQLVGRDTAKMDIAACRRAAIESMSENLTDGFVSPVFWYTLGGLPGVALFKVVSTMDSMVGYKTPRYLKFGWCGARLDDLMNLIPARMTWLLLSAVALFLPGCSMRKALAVGWIHHAIVPGPNSGWAEATAAGAIQRRLAGPIWAAGKLVNEVWIGHPADPSASLRDDLRRAAILIAVAGLVCSALAILALSRAGGFVAFPQPT